MRLITPLFLLSLLVLPGHVASAVTPGHVTSYRCAWTSVALSSDLHANDNVAAQDAGKQSTGKQSTGKKAKKKQKKKPEKPKWPKLKFSKKSTAKDKITQLVSKKEPVQESARAKILSYGAGVCPTLLAAYHDRQKQPILDALHPLLDELITKELGPVLEISTKDNNEILTLFTLSKLDSFEDPRYQAWFRGRTKHKNIEIADLRAFLEKKLDDMLNQNRTRRDFAERLQDIIDNYNAGSNSADRDFAELV